MLPIFLVLVTAGCLGRIALGCLGLRAVATLPRLEEAGAPALASWPRVSIVVPARNEAHAVEGALLSRLRLDYPDLEVVAVDDRSSDATGGILDRIAASDARVRPIHVRELPPGWLGKVHALHAGVTRARGEWLLITDADVELAPDALRRAVAHAERQRLDFLTAVPTLLPASPAVDVLMADLMRTLLPLLQADWILNPRSSFAAGGGAFMLLRRAAYAKTRGLEELKLEVVDDMALGQLMKTSGARCGVVNGAGLVRLVFYRSLSDAAVGAEKAFGSVARYSMSRLVLTAAVMLLLGVAPILAIGVHAAGWLTALGMFAAVLDVGSAVVMTTACGMRPLPALFVPLGSVLMAAMLLRSGWLAWRRGGILWRGTLYSTDLLRTGMRYRFPWG